MRPARLVIPALVLAAVLCPGAASANILAATEVPDPAAGTHDTDVALVDTATGGRIGLPAGINTADDELHPSITPDGKRMVFERFNVFSDTTRIIAVDLTTGTQADLFNAFATAQFKPAGPTITSDGQTALTGMSFPQQGNDFVVGWTETSLANFPAGPFAHTLRTEPDLAFASAGVTRDPDVTPSGIVALGVQRSGTVFGVLVDDHGQHKLFTDPGFEEHPALSEPGGVVVFEHAPGGFGTSTDLSFRTLVAGQPAGSTLTVPGVNDLAVLALDPAFTQDGRYLLFITIGNDGVEHLLTFDTDTQTLLNSSGVTLGTVPFFGRFGRENNISIRQAFVLVNTAITFTGPNPIVAFMLKAQSGVGILVQRIVGHHRLFGRRVPTLRLVGRVPFGSFRRGHHRVRWNLRVNGKRLRRGTYLVTPRALTSRGIVRELGKPRVLTIH